MARRSEERSAGIGRAVTIERTEKQRKPDPDLEQRGLLENPGTLAPMLRQLEKQKLLLGDWDGARDGPQKYYTLSEKGADTFSQMTEEWRKVAEELQKLIEGDGSDDID